MEDGWNNVERRIAELWIIYLSVLSDVFVELSLVSLLVVALCGFEKIYLTSKHKRSQQ